MADRDLSRSRAILIGNSTYRPDSGIVNLPAASKCVAAMTRLLTSDLCGWPETCIEPLVDIAARHELARKIHRAVKDVEGVVLLYYVGHGLRTPRGSWPLPSVTATAIRRCFLTPRSSTRTSPISCVAVRPTPNW